MTRLWKQTSPLLLLAASAAFAGGLRLEVGNPSANPEAKKMGAVLTARVTACHEPAKSTVTADMVQENEGNVIRTPLKVTPLGTPGMFAVTGAPEGKEAVIELSVNNPQFGDYRPRTLVKVDAQGIQWSRVKRFADHPPTANDIKLMAWQR